MSTRRRLVAVFGAGDARAEVLSRAEAVGRALGEAGCWVVTGGLGGVMAAVSRGAREAGAETIGLLPGADRGAANENVSIAIPTGLGEARNALVAASGEGAIAIGGELGTLSEIAHALRLGRPVVTLGSWELDRGRLLPHRRLLHAEAPVEAVTRLLAELDGDDPRS